MMAATSEKINKTKKGSENVVFTQKMAFKILSFY